MHQVTQMSLKRHPISYWTKERCKELASNYKTRKEFCKKKRHVYDIAKSNNWLDEISPLHDKFHKQKPNGFWVYETCKEEAAKYKDKTQFNKKAPQAYNISVRNGWLHEICSHMVCQGRKDLRYVYAFEFEDNHVYIGLTCDLERRKNEHLFKKTNSSVNEHITKTNEGYKFVPLITEPINLIEAGKLEAVYINTYRDDGWTILNKSKAGGIGGYTRKWTYSKCKKAASTCKSRTEYHKKYPGAYHAAFQNNWLYELFTEPKKEILPQGYWTKERCAEAAKKCTKRFEFTQKYAQAHNVIKKNGWFELIDHMEYGYGHFKKKWTYETCKEEAAKYITRTDFSDNNGSAYSVSLKNKWLDEFFPK